MGQVNRHLETVAFKDASIVEADFAEHFEHGAGSATLTGTYTKFTTEFLTAPHVVATGYGSVVYLAEEPDVGSFALKQSTAGTISANYVAWGARA